MSPVVASMLNGRLLDGLLLEASIEYVTVPNEPESASTAIAYGQTNISFSKILLGQ